MKILNISRKLSLGILISTFLVGCTDLEIDNIDSIIPEEEGGNPTEILSALYLNISGVYGAYNNAHALENVTSDLHIPPTRTTGDWADGGNWRSLHSHDWTPTHPEVNAAWTSLNRNIFAASEVLFWGGSDQEIAEAKFLRAYAMWQLTDLFGVVPIREVDEPVEINPIILSRQEALDRVIQDLNDAITALPSSAPANHNVATKEAAYALNARVYLNKAVYEADAPGSFNFSTTDMNEVIASADGVIDAGYTLTDDYYLNWRASGTENIFVSVNDMFSYWLPYLSSGQGGWNGFSITPELYDLYDTGDDRLGKGPGTTGYVFDSNDFDPSDDALNIPQGILVGQQYRKNGELLEGVNYVKETQLLGADPNAGYKLMKNIPDFPTKIVHFRYADVLLMKAEAILRGGTSSDTALDIINEIRASRNATLLTDVTLDDILEERGREMQWESVRRTDQIRFGTFLSGTWTEKSGTTDDHKWIFPIPEVQVSLNPNLEQNPGY
ncbi:RagB/SusD family nutrient uptake outer membrane protein [Flavivirga aquimarina]|uniref:RagB/SusD family nutrient uptake outer membrane protein n=1 Tax=Flavivirga aquimarina TaxID=2027862 RepID=A0ABT8WFD1_9FLAO|nr:RagB/SusD family nutrient uptake outer membrane protein [Flavivirga aquimarina]MDO5971782.1 RagB/SusD family nutrient uptake outer membrane protein [Flavivirga aquimarina]